MSPFIDRTLTRLTLPLAFLFVLAFTAMASLAYAMGWPLGIDFGVYWRTASGPAAQAYQWAGLYIFPYAPTMLLWIEPLAWAPRPLAFLLFDIASVALFVVALRNTLPRVAMLLCLISAPVVAGLLTGQVVLLLTAVLIVACRADNRWLAGVLFGLIASIKPQFVIMAPLVMLSMRDWRALAASAATFTAIILLALLLFGPDRWPEWLAALDRLHAAVAGSNIERLGITPAMVADRFGLGQTIGWAIGIAAGLALALKGRKDDPLDRATLIGVASLLAAPYALRYDMTVAMPFVALALARRQFLMLLALVPLYPLPLIVVALSLLRRPFPQWASTVRPTPPA